MQTNKFIKKVITDCLEKLWVLPALKNFNSVPSSKKRANYWDLFDAEFFITSSVCSSYLEGN